MNKYLIITCCLLVSQALTAQTSIQEALKNAPKEVPDKVTVVRSEDGKRLSAKTLTYLYDRTGRLTEIKSSTDDYHFSYSYTGNKVSRVVVTLRNNGYVQADFTYNAKGAMTRVVRTGQQKATLQLSDKYDTRQTYAWTDARGNTHELYMDNLKNNHKIVEHRVGKDAFKFTYEKSGTTGLENLPVPITLATYMAMDYYTTNFYADGFFQCILPQPLATVTDPRENGKRYTYSHTKGLYSYLKESSVKQGSEWYQWTFSYRKPVTELKIEDKSPNDKQVIRVKKI